MQQRLSIIINAPDVEVRYYSQLNLNMLSNIIIVPAGSTREFVHGLARKTEVTVQVLAQNAAGKSALSTAVSIGIA